MFCLLFLLSERIKVGAVEEVKVAKVDFDFVKAVTKPTVMALRLVDKLFPKEVLMNSTVHGTKDFAPLDHRIIAAIKGKLTTLNLFSSLNIQFKHLQMSKEEVLNLVCFSLCKMQRNERNENK